MGIYGCGVVAPGACDLPSFVACLEGGKTALAPSPQIEFGPGLFAVGDPEFSFDSYASWIAKRHGEPYAARFEKKMGDNVQFAVGAAIQAIEAQPGIEAAAREADESCHIYIGSGVGDLPQSYAAQRSFERAQRAWNHFWASPERCAVRRRLETERIAPEGTAPPADPRDFAVDSPERHDALASWEEFWAARSDRKAEFLERFARVEKLEADDTTDDNFHLAAIRKRARAHRALIEEYGCPPPPWTSVSAKLIWNIQNSPASQLTMLLGVHGPAWAPVGACSTFGVALACAKSAIERDEAKIAIVGTTDPRPDPILVGAFHEARVMPGNPDVNAPLTTLGGTHVSGGACIWVVGEEDWCRARGLTPLAFVDAVALSSDAEHIITPSKQAPKRAIDQAYKQAGIAPGDVSIFDMHATGTPGDLNELELIHEFIGPQTRLTVRKGQLGHGMANSGGWELTALAMSLSSGTVFPTGIEQKDLHPRVAEKSAIVTLGERVRSPVAAKLMLGIGGITGCVVLRGAD